MLACFSARGQTPPPSDAAQTAQSAWSSFLAGDAQRARSAYEYLQTLGVAKPDPDANLALLSRDAGRHDDALTHWVKASLKDGSAGFLWNQRGWTYAALERLPEARESFLKALDRSSTTADQAESRIGLGWTAFLAAQPKQALGPLKSSLGTSPFTMAAASYAAALAAQAAGDRYSALAYLRQCVSLDPLNLECLKDLAVVHARTGENRASWYAGLRVLALDPEDGDMARQIRKLREYIPGDPDAAMPVRRLARPLLPPEPEAGEALPHSQTSVRVALFTGRDGRPATATRLNFMCNSEFRVISAAGETVKDDGKPQNQWEIIFRPENNVVELRDTERNIAYASKQPFRIVPGGRQGSVLLKSARFNDPVGIDTGDRELRGAIDVVPNPYGFFLVNETGLEEYLFGVVSVALPHGSPAEAYKAQAVVSRTRALWAKAHRTENPERSDFCDSETCQKYSGLSEEMRDAANGVRQTAGAVLSRSGQPALLLEHDNCGGLTEDGRLAKDPEAAFMTSVSDGESPDSFRPSPDQLELWTHEYPPANRYCDASGLTAPVDSRWLRIIPGTDLAARARRLRDIGSLRGVRVLRRSATGRVQALEIIGSKQNLTLEGEQLIAKVLSPGSLRSTLFTLQPLMAGNRLERLLIWGAGTGHGIGLCRDGLLGQAAMGKKWREILAHYFPALRAELFKSQAASKPAVKIQTGRKRPRNPHWLKKS
jgi:peptidoglycan hydrolase-like amidase/Flp pilus assembly protein TadD